MEDIEGNGIEIYRDKEEHLWDKREDGRIIGVTEVMDAQGVLSSANSESSEFFMPEGTIVGHVHLSVSNAKVSSEFYQKLLNMGDKYSVDSASWIASGEYHHHLAFNNWQSNVVERKDNELGIEELNIITDNKDTFLLFLNNAREINANIETKEDNGIVIRDLDGIKVRITHY